EHAAETILWPAMAKLLPKYPDVNVEIITDYGLTNIVAERYDAGVRLGEQVDKDMIAVPIEPDLRMAVVAAPSYFQGRRPPRTPQELTDHTAASICVYPPTEASTPGNSGRVVASLKSASRVAPSSTRWR
ncbi:MAG TPA: LysR substrate-binding domain-containing protein, partial [Sphingomicrobium sp.]|nr:LysR substrate-binding domain-containing protein [Sphingomicrobium sp.]